MAWRQRAEFARSLRACRATVTATISPPGGAEAEGACPICGGDFPPGARPPAAGGRIVFVARGLRYVAVVDGRTVELEDYVPV